MNFLWNTQSSRSYLCKPESVYPGILKIRYIWYSNSKDIQQNCTKFWTIKFVKWKQFIYEKILILFFIWHCQIFYDFHTIDEFIVIIKYSNWAQATFSLRLIFFIPRGERKWKCSAQPPSYWLSKGLAS